MLLICVRCNEKLKILPLLLYLMEHWGNRLSRRQATIDLVINSIEAAVTIFPINRCILLLIDYQIMLGVR